MRDRVFSSGCTGATSLRLPFRNAWFRYQLADEGRDKTLFTASLEFEMPWGALGAWLGKKMEKIVETTVSDVATSMKLYYETGKPKRWPPAINGKNPGKHPARYSCAKWQMPAIPCGICARSPV